MTAGGEAWWFASLGDVPQVRNLRAVRSYERIVWTWDAPEGVGNDISYEYRRAVGAAVFAGNWIATNARNILVGGLNPGTNYRFQVRALLGGRRSRAVEASAITLAGNRQIANLAAGNYYAISGERGWNLTDGSVVISPTIADGTKYLVSVRIIRRRGDNGLVFNVSTSVPAGPGVTISNLFDASGTFELITDAGTSIVLLASNALRPSYVYTVQRNAISQADVDALWNALSSQNDSEAATFIFRDYDPR